MKIILYVFFCAYILFFGYQELSHFQNTASNNSKLSYRRRSPAYSGTAKLEAKANDEKNSVASENPLTPDAVKDLEALKLAIDPSSVEHGPVEVKIVQDDSEIDYVKELRKGLANAFPTAILIFVLSSIFGEVKTFPQKKTVPFKLGKFFEFESAAEDPRNLKPVKSHKRAS